MRNVLQISFGPNKWYKEEKKSEEEKEDVRRRRRRRLTAHSPIQWQRRSTHTYAGNVHRSVVYSSAQRQQVHQCVRFMRRCVSFCSVFWREIVSSIIICKPSSSLIILCVRMRAHICASSRKYDANTAANG